MRSNQIGITLLPQIPLTRSHKPPRRGQLARQIAHSQAYLTKLNYTVTTGWLSKCSCWTLLTHTPRTAPQAHDPRAVSHQDCHDQCRHAQKQSAGALDNTKPETLPSPQHRAPSHHQLLQGLCCVGSGLVLDSKALIEALPDLLGQVAGGGIPLPGSSQGLLVELQDLSHLIVQAIV